jgi:hypothetical protein
MEMQEDMTIRVQAIVNDQKLTRAEKIKALQGLYVYTRAEKPGAAQSPIVDVHSLNETLLHIETALADLGEPIPGHHSQNTGSNT